MSGNRSSSSSSGSGNRAMGGSRSNANSNSGSQVICAICSECYRESDKIFAGSCGHVFHWQCLQRWWEESKACPICREDNAEYFQIYLHFEESGSSQNSTANSGVPGFQAHLHENDNSDDFANMLYEARLYREEIEYLNKRIENLTVKRILGLNSDDSD